MSSPKSLGNKENKHKIQTLCLTKLQTLGILNLPHGETPPSRDCSRIANRLRRDLGQDYSGRECRTLNSARR